MSLKVDKSLFNRERDKDVLLSNGRCALPRFIPSHTFEHISRLLDEEDVLFLKKHYIDVGKAQGYLLNSVPFFLGNAEIERCVKKSRNKTIDFLSRWYDRCEGGFQLKDAYIDENNELLILSVIKRKDLWIDDADRARLSTILKESGFTGFPPFLYCSMKVDTTHYYFYHKDYEHIPGVMLIEAARQASYLYLFWYLGFKNNELVLSLTKYNIEFMNYVQSNFPVCFKVEEISKRSETFGNTGVERVSARICVYQLGGLACVVEIYGSLIRNDIFNDIRSDHIYDGLWFKPVRNFHKYAAFTDMEGHKFEYPIERISVKAFEVQCGDNSMPDSAVYHFSIYIEKLGLVNGKCTVVSREETLDGCILRLGIMDMSKEDCRRLSEGIKIYSYVHQDKDLIDFISI